MKARKLKKLFLVMNKKKSAANGVVDCIYHMVLKASVASLVYFHLDLDSV
jgi:hypothetical protein